MMTISNKKLNYYVVMTVRNLTQCIVVLVNVFLEESILDILIAYTIT